MEDKKEKEDAGTSQNTASDKQEERKYYTVSKVFPDGTIADMVYSKEIHRADFVIAQGSKVYNSSELLVNKQEVSCKYLPSYEICGLINKNFIYAASGVEEYGSTLDLYKEIREFIKKYVIMEDERFYDVATGYILMTWIFDRFNTLPYLRVVGELGTGKSRFLEVVGKLCHRVMVASGSISMAALFRTLDIVEGTLAFDEADFRSSEMTDDIIKILNSGHKKDAPVVRMEIVNDVLKPRSFRVFGPKVLGSRHPFVDTALESRCVSYRLFPLKGLKVPVHLPQSFEAEAQTFRNKLLMFRMKNFHQIHDDESSIEGLDFPRLRQTALALTSVVKFISEDIHKSVIGYLLDYQKDILDSVSTDIYADVVLCIAWIAETDEDVRKSGELSMNRIALEFNNSFYDDYTTRETRSYERRDGGPLIIPGQQVSPRKIGTYIDKLGLAKERNSKGIFIPLAREARRIGLLVERYSLSKVIEERKSQKAKAPKVPRNEFKEDDPHPY